jgi:hypothetical protein
MNRRAYLTFVALIMLLQLGGALAYAQTPQRIRAEIGFPFVAGGKELPAGAYTVEVTPAGPVMISGANGARALMPVITTLGRHDQDPDAEFVFDKVDGKSVLSELWMPKRDGLLLLATKGPHEHVVLGGSNPRK